jgi:outer membrane immunogenic protein
VASENFYFSLKLGGNLANLSNIDGTKNALGLNFGLMASIKLSEKFYLVPEFMPLSPKGAKNIAFRSTGNASLDQLMQPTTSSATQMNYIDIPIVAKYYATKELGLEAGPQISILTSATDIYRGKIKEDDDLTYENDVKSSFNTIDIGVVVGLTYSLWDARGGKGLFVHARYAYGLMDIVKDNPGDAIKNSVFQFAVSFPFIIPPEQQEGAK